MSDELCHKERRLVDAQIVVDMNTHFPHTWSPEEEAKELERITEDLRAFLNEHDAYRGVQVFLDRRYEDICSACHDDWEIEESDDGLRCACCGVIVEKG